MQLRPKLFTRNFQPQSLNQVTVPTGSPGRRQLVSVGIEMDTPRGGGHRPAVEQNFQGVSGRHAGTELTGHGCGGPLVGIQVDPAVIHQISYRQHGGGESEQET